MNTQTQEALKMAIEALDFFQTHSEFWKDTADEAIQACKEALAQPQPKLFLDLSNSNGNHPVQQEPVAWMNPSNGAVICKQKKKQIGLDGKVNGYGNFSVPLTDHPALSWQGLSDDEINVIKTKAIVGAKGLDIDKLLHLIVNLSEQALKEKNT